MVILGIVIKQIVTEEWSQKLEEWKYEVSWFFLYPILVSIKEILFLLSMIPTSKPFLNES